MSMQDAGLPTSLIVEGKRKNLGGHIIVDPMSFRAKTCNNLVLDQDNNLYQITMNIMTWSLKKNVWTLQEEVGTIQLSVAGVTRSSYKPQSSEDGIDSHI